MRILNKLTNVSDDLRMVDVTLGEGNPLQRLPLIVECSADVNEQLLDDIRFLMLKICQIYGVDVELVAAHDLHDSMRRLLPEPVVLVSDTLQSIDLTLIDAVENLRETLIFHLAVIDQNVDNGQLHLLDVCS